MFTNPFFDSLEASGFSHYFAIKDMGEEAIPTAHSD